MGIETALAAGLIGGTVMQGVGSIMGNRRQEQSQERARQDALQNQAWIRATGQGMMQNGPSSWEQAVTNQLPGLWERTNTSFSPTAVASQGYNAANSPDAIRAAIQGYTAGTATTRGYTPERIDLGQMGQAVASRANIDGFEAMMAQAALANAPERVAAREINIGDIFNRTGYNTGNDALMQLLRSDPSRQMTATDNAMAEMLATGNPFNTSAQSANLQKLYGLNLNDAISRIQGSTGRLGARFGSATQQNVGRSVERMVAEQNVLQGGMEQSAFESAQGRRMSAAQLLAQLEAARRASTIDAAKATQSAAGLGLQGEQANQAAMLQAALANQGVTQQTALANQGALNQFSLANQGAYNAAGMQTQSLQAQAAMQAAQLQAQVSMANLQARLAALGQNATMGNEAAQFGANAENVASMYNVGQENTAAQFGANAANAANLNYANNQTQNNQFNTAQQNTAAQFGANSANQANQFNAAQALAAYQASQSAQNSAVGQYLSALGLGSQINQGQQGLNNQIFGIMAGVPTPGANPAAGAQWNAFGQLGGGIQDSLMSWWLMQQMGGRSGAPPASGTGTMVNNPFPQLFG